jgi:hypothetical protein
VRVEPGSREVLARQSQARDVRVFHPSSVC